MDYPFLYVNGNEWLFTSLNHSICCTVLFCIRTFGMKNGFGIGLIDKMLIDVYFNLLSLCGNED
jgi:hypothetical protein